MKIDTINELDETGFLTKDSYTNLRINLTDWLLD